MYVQAVSLHAHLGSHSSPPSNLNLPNFNGHFIRFSFRYRTASYSSLCRRYAIYANSSAIMPSILFFALPPSFTG